MIGMNIDEAKEVKRLCEKFVQEKLNLELSRWHIYKMKKAIKKVKIHAVGTATMKFYRKLLIEFSILNLLPKGAIKCLNM